MPFPSVFGFDKEVYPDKFPKPPTMREMLEDIGSMTQDDPVITFAEVLLKKGSDSVSADDDRVPVVPDMFQKDECVGDWLIDSLAVAAIRDTKPKSQIIPKSPGGFSSISSAKELLTSSITLDDFSDVHTQLKELSTACTKGEDLLVGIESKIKQIESHYQQIRNNAKE